MSALGSAEGPMMNSSGHPALPPLPVMPAKAGIQPFMQDTKEALGIRFRGYDMRGGSAGRTPQRGRYGTIGIFFCSALDPIAFHAYKTQ
jgi:hypothetical protein